MNLNDLRELENKVKITRIEACFCLSLEPLCTKFGERWSNISSAIEQKPFKMILNAFRDI